MWVSHFIRGQLFVTGSPLKIWGSSGGMSKSFRLTLRCANNNDHHFDWRQPQTRVSLAYIFRNRGARGWKVSRTLWRTTVIGHYAKWMKDKNEGNFVEWQHAAVSSSQAKCAWFVYKNRNNNAYLLYNGSTSPTRVCHIDCDVHYLDIILNVRPSKVASYPDVLVPCLARCW